MLQAPEIPNQIARLVRLAVNGGLLAGCLAFGSAAHAGITFQFDYGTNNGTGFWDAIDGATRRAAMDTASTAFSSMFGSHFSNSATILLAASATNDATSSNLASAGSESILSGVAGFTVNDIVRTKALGGADGNGALADGTVNVNFGQPWHYDLGTQAPDTKYDFYSTIYHEFTHALGFASTFSQNGQGYALKEWGTYDQFVVDKNGNRVINATTFELNQSVWDAASVGSTGAAGSAEHVAGAYFDGAFAKAANGGNAVALYSRPTWSDGSSISHTDDDTAALYGTMMTAEGPTGPWPRDYSAIEVGMMRDLGYTVAAVPEPESYAMLLAGLGLMGLIARRRRQT